MTSVSASVLSARYYFSKEIFVHHVKSFFKYVPRLHFFQICMEIAFYNSWLLFFIIVLYNSCINYTRLLISNLILQRYLAELWDKKSSQINSSFSTLFYFFIKSRQSIKGKYYLITHSWIMTSLSSELHIFLQPWPETLWDDSVTIKKDNIYTEILVYISGCK